MEFVVLQSFPNYIEAHIAMGRLEEENIRCWLKDENTVTIDPILTNAVGGIKLMVAASQAGRALDLLQQYSTERKSRQACPHCSSNDIELVSTPRKAVNWLTALAGFFFGDYAIGASKVWHCFHCSAEFKDPVELTARDHQSPTPESSKSEA